MMDKRKVEVFSAGCPVCDETVRLVQALACPSCEVEVRPMSDPDVVARARDLGVRSLPAVAVNGKLAACCASSGVSTEELKAEGVGQPL